MTQTSTSTTVSDDRIMDNVDAPQILPAASDSSNSNISAHNPVVVEVGPPNNTDNASPESFEIDLFHTPCCCGLWSLISLLDIAMIVLGCYGFSHYQTTITFLIVYFPLDLLFSIIKLLGSCLFVRPCGDCCQSSSTRQRLFTLWLLGQFWVPVALGGRIYCQATGVVDHFNTALIIYHYFSLIFNVINMTLWCCLSSCCGILCLVDARKKHRQERLRQSALQNLGIPTSLEQVRQLWNQHFTDSPFEATCPICLENYAPQEELIALPCHHTFHRTCIAGTIQTAIGEITCPICRQTISSSPNPLPRNDNDNPPAITISFSPSS